MAEAEVVFIAGPDDVSDECYAIAAKVRELAAESKRPLEPYYWKADAETWSTQDTWQVQITERANKLGRVAAVICAFGEKIGTPLPKEVRSKLKLDGAHEWWRSIDVDAKGDAGKVPVTGTVYEALDAVSSSPRRELLLLAVGGKRTLDYSIKSAHDRDFGHSRRHRQIQLWEVGTGATDSSAGARAYEASVEHHKQVEWLRIWYDDVVIRNWPVKHVDAHQAPEAAETWLRDVLGIPSPLHTGNPYRLLDKYKDTDKDLYHGRKTEIGHLFDMLAAQESPADEGAPSIIVVHGASGEGKSSFLQAGIKARAKSWRPNIKVGLLDAARIPPGQDPLLALAGELVESAEELASFAEDGHLTAARLLRTLSRPDLNSSRRILILVDQFEQIVAEHAIWKKDVLQRPDEPFRWREFLRFIGEFVRRAYRNRALHGDLRGSIVITIPTNWYKTELRPIIVEFCDDPAAPDRVWLEDKELSAPSDDAIREIVREPLKLARAPFKEDFVKEVVDQAASYKHLGEGSLLVVLSMALHGVYEEWVKKKASTKGKDEGLMSKVVVIDKAGFGDFVKLDVLFERLGNAALEIAPGVELTASKRASLRRLFRHLVRDSGGDLPVREFLPMESTVYRELRTELIQPLWAKRLLRETTRSGKNGVELAHDAILSSWGAARDWLASNKNLLRQQLTLQNKAAVWDETGRPRDRLAGRREADDFEEVLTEWELAGDLPRAFVRESLKRSWARKAQRGKNEVPHLTSAIVFKDPELVEFYLQHGADPNLVDEETDDTPLMTAASKSDAKTVKVLLHHRAHPGAADKWAQTALMLAAQAGSIECIDLLLPLEPNVDRQGAWQRSVLFYAIFSGRVEVVRKFLDRGADAGRSDKDGWFPLGIAAYQGHSEIAQILLERGAKVDLGAAGRTPLMIAAANGRVSVIEELLRHRPDIDEKDRDGRTALTLAARARSAQGMIQILRAGGSVLRPEANAETALDGCLAARDDSALQALLEHAKPAELWQSLLEVDAHGDSASTRIHWHESPTREELIRDWMQRHPIPTENVDFRMDPTCGEDEHDAWRDLPGPSFAWEIPSVDRRSRILKGLDQFEMSYRCARSASAGTLRSVRVATLSCYPGLEIAELLFEVDAGAEPKIRSVLVDKETGSCIAPLNGKSAAIHWLNTKWLRIGSEAQQIEYIRFFCQYIHGAEGGFSPVETGTDLSLSHRLGSEFEGVTIGAITPEQRGGESGPPLFSMLVCYGNDLFKAWIEVQPDGVVKMLEDRTRFSLLGGTRRAARRGFFHVFHETEPSERWSPLHWAIALGLKEVVQRCLAAGLPADAQRNGLHVLNLAARSSDETTVQQILAAAGESVGTLRHGTSFAFDLLLGGNEALLREELDKLSREELYRFLLSPLDGRNLIEWSADQSLRHQLDGPGHRRVWELVRGRIPEIVRLEKMTTAELALRVEPIHASDQALKSGMPGVDAWKAVAEEQLIDEALRLIVSAAQRGRFWFDAGLMIGAIRIGSLSFYPGWELVEVFCWRGKSHPKVHWYLLFSCLRSKDQRQRLYALDGRLDVVERMRENDYALRLDSFEKRQAYLQFWLSISGSKMPFSLDDLSFTHPLRRRIAKQIESAWRPLTMLDRPDLDARGAKAYRGTFLRGETLLAGEWIFEADNRLEQVGATPLMTGLPSLHAVVQRNKRVFSAKMRPLKILQALPWWKRFPWLP